MRGRPLAAVLLGVALVLTFAGASPGAESPWDKFDLATVEVEGVTIRYERVLEPQIADVKSAVAGYSARENDTQAQVDRLVADGGVFKKMDDFLGTRGDDGFRADRMKVFVSLARESSILRRAGEIIVITGSTIKDRLRAGDTLPEFSYDKATDKVTYLPRLGFSSAQQKSAAGPLVLPIMQPGDAGKEAAGFLGGFGSSDRIGLALHEATEFTMLMRLRTGEPHIRWFSGGFSNAITIRLIESHVGKTAAASYAAGYKADAYRDIEKDVNLAWWLASMYEIRTDFAPERKLVGARYAYATFEAERIIGAHGLECVRKIFDRMPEKNVARGDVMKAIRETTGEDMEARLALYQRFDTREKGSEIHTAALKSAVERKDYPATLWAVLRLMELQDGYNATFYGVAAECMLKMGREDLGAEALLSQIRVMKANKRDDLRIGLEGLFCKYSFTCGKPQKAHELAEEVLAAKPDYVPALAVRMHRLYVSARKDDAVKTAQRILELDKDNNSFFNQKANEVIAEFAGR